MLKTLINLFREPLDPYIIEYRGKFWDGESWTKNRKNAMQFPSAKKAWIYVDNNWDEEYDISLECV